MDAVTSLTVGAVVSIAMLLLSASEPAAPGLASVRIASFAAASRIVPPLSVSALVAA